MTPTRATADDLEDDVQATEKAANGRPNAFTRLMTPKPKVVDQATQKTKFLRADGLGPYIKDPESFPASRVVYHNDKFVVINDLYPKASVHLLILPRNADRNYIGPQDAFDDPEFLTECRAELVKVRKIAASELRRRFGKQSKAEQRRLQAMDLDEPPEELPTGRDWEKDIISGIHANPSMSHLHIHVLSRDMVSPCMKKTNHYLSFTTDFLVDLDQFPLEEDDHRRHYRHFPSDLICWRCGKSFGNKISQLKDHLDDEFKAWIAE